MVCRDLTLAPRVEDIRDKQSVQVVVEFDLAQIKERFDQNLASISKQFDIAEVMRTEGKVEECETIWRSQVVFLESALDFYIHEVSKYGMLNIFSGNWGKTEKYNNYQVPLKYVEEGFKHPESKNWLLQYLNERFSTEVYLSSESMKNQLNLLGLFFETVMEKAFPKPSTPVATYREGKKVVKELFERRNQIAHQTDRKHNDAVPNTISKEYVEQCFADVKAIADSIQAIAIEKNNE